MTGATAAELAVADYVGRQRVERDEVVGPLCKRLAALLDLDPEAICTGDELPLGWSAILFSTTALQSELGPDGHGVHDDFLPPPPLPRRMFAGREIILHRPLRIGQAVERTSTIEAITPKSGRNGKLVFVTVRHDIANGDGLAITERQNIVYREEAAGSAAASSPALELPEARWTESFTADPAALFRYSALTFNAHRIHYDAPYTRDVEGYPGLVINGGYTTLKLLELFRARLNARPLSYAVRAIRPLIAGRAHMLNVAPTPEGALLWASDEAGQLALKIDVRTVP